VGQFYCWAKSSRRSLALPRSPLAFSFHPFFTADGVLQKTVPRPVFRTCTQPTLHWAAVTLPSPWHPVSLRSANCPTQAKRRLEWATRQDRSDTLILVSGDSDLVPALKMIKARFPQKTLIVYVPTRNPVRGAAVELRSAADKNRDLPLNLLPLSQFPQQLSDGRGGLITKPPTW
jgi:hypothetical protein